MSLDLYIKSNTPVKHRGTGIYIREQGGTRELKTKEEVLKYFPDINIDLVKETSYEDDTYFHINLTHNLTKMADECKMDPHSKCITIQGEKPTLYTLLWHPEEILEIGKPTMEYIEGLVSCYVKLVKEGVYFRNFNPSNGWGTYEQLLKGTKEYINALMSISENLDNYVIEASV